MGLPDLQISDDDLGAVRQLVATQPDAAELMDALGL
jgi:hypothetical protein